MGEVFTHLGSRYSIALASGGGQRIPAKKKTIAAGGDRDTPVRKKKKRRLNFVAASGRRGNAGLLAPRLAYALRCPPPPVSARCFAPPFAAQRRLQLERERERERDDGLKRERNEYKGKNLPQVQRMMWAADFDEAVARHLDEACLEPLVLHLHEVSNIDDRKENMNGKQNCNGAGSQKNHRSFSSNNGPISLRYPFCGLTKDNLWPRHDQLHLDTIDVLWRTEDDEMPVFCAAAILIINRHKIMRETRSIDDVIKMFNDNRLKIRVKHCIRRGIKLRRKYFSKLIRQTDTRCSERYQ